MVIQTASASELPSRGLDEITSSRKEFFERLLEKVEFAYVFISFFFFTDAVLMVVLSGGASEGDGFSYDAVNYTLVHLFYVAHNLLSQCKAGDNPHGYNLHSYLGGWIF
ncbi:MAG: hypothetical protein AAFN42_22070, partial [Cyanobacteria bacterium J06554_1]